MPFDPAVLRVMAITDGLRDGPADLADRAAAAVEGGATCVQVRLKSVPSHVIADVTRAIVARVDVPVLVNDRFDIALVAGAAGVHLGADDIPVAVVRQLVSSEFIIGTSVGCDDEVENARLANYVGIGPVYVTDSKSDAGAAIGLAEFARLAEVTKKPAVAIGGITADSAQAIVQAGAAGVAVVSAIFGAHDPVRAAQALADAVSLGLAVRAPRRI